MSSRIPIICSFAIYGGGHHLGDVAELATGQYAAFDPTGRRIGVFNHRADAELAAWNNTVVLREQPSITIYVNPHGAAIIRQEGTRDEDGDSFILIHPQNARALAAAILQAAGIEDLMSDEGAS
jgi:hypothetical protein